MHRLDSGVVIILKQRDNEEAGGGSRGTVLVLPFMFGSDFWETAQICAPS